MVKLLIRLTVWLTVPWEARCRCVPVMMLTSINQYKFSCKGFFIQDLTQWFRHSLNSSPQIPSCNNIAPEVMSTSVDPLSLCLPGAPLECSRHILHGVTPLSTEGQHWSAVDTSCSYTVILFGTLIYCTTLNLASVVL